MAAAIEIDGLSKIYTKRKSAPVVAVDDLSLSIPAGQIFGFLGSNGAGKTTTIKMACGLVLPTSGSVRLHGHDVQRQRGQAMRQIGAVLEGTRNVYWRLTAWQNLLYFGRIKGVSGNGLKDRAERLLRELELWERRNDPVRDFSRGMQQKVAIACALVADPPIVLLDEPTLGLDVQAGRTVKRWVEQLVRKEGKTVVLTTHQMDLAESLCDRVAIMSQGKLVTNRPTGELLGLFRQETYELRFRGKIDEAIVAGFDGFTPREENGHTILSGTISEHDRLYRLLEMAEMQGLELLGVAQADPNLEEIFVELLERAGKGERNPEQSTNGRIPTNPKREVV
ncbi:MAG: ABC transporter ATP-binding protein [Caldilineaceae bacterium]|nr:ABC transporter ATP-binding protein [Caldilineaceae bacterium]HRJ42671.1 ABC transporter ATP-binding protein [Caldilineaceae bacterium]